MDIDQAERLIDATNRMEAAAMKMLRDGDAFLDAWNNGKPFRELRARLAHSVEMAELRLQELDAAAVPIPDGSPVGTQTAGVAGLCREGIRVQRQRIKVSTAIGGE
jgi:hypothetical protein